MCSSRDVYPASRRLLASQNMLLINYLKLMINYSCVKTLFTIVLFISILKHKRNALAKKMMVLQAGLTKQNKEL
jgi:hypothetical protein